MKSLVTSVVDYVRQDWAENKIRTVLEITAYCTSIVCSVIMALTVPDVPFVLLYPLFIAHCAVFAWCAWTRGSTGMVANYLTLVTIDTVALWRLMI
ncbi:MAG: hypothetical protein EBR30_03015 [Cytophagia bacterium]|jgi:hypothetical protein|nr:hypothetical protein [Cytophagia bacterium]NBW34006.1 hypothetical protein [Cytophagia bacterium]